MENIFDAVLGFLPRRSVFWVGLGISLFILLFHLITNKLVKWIELPYMKLENQKARAKMIQQLKREKKTES